MTGREGQADWNNVISLIGTLELDIEYLSSHLEDLLLNMGHIPEAIPEIISSTLKLGPKCVNHGRQPGKRTIIIRTAKPSDRVCTGCNVAKKCCPLRLVWEYGDNRNLIDSSIRNIVKVD